MRTLTWFAVLAAPLAWAVQHVVGFGLTVAGCGPEGHGVAIDGWTVVLTVGAALVAIAAELAAFVVFRRTRGDMDGDPPRSRIYFLSVVGLTINPLFLCIVVLSGVGVVVLANCAQPAAAQPPSGVARPANEDRLPLPELGAQLYAGNCASCHGSRGEGVRPPGAQQGTGSTVGLGPRLRGVGAQAADFYLRTGYMPLGDPHEQPERGPALFNGREQRALVQFVAALGRGPAIPVPHPAQGDLSQGRELFTDHCAGCHQVAAQGGIVTGARVPPLDKATPVEIAEAVRVGPYVMPNFSPRDITDAQLDSIVRYVEYATHRPDDRGGWAIDRLGPFPEGMVAWLLGGLGLIVVCMLIGARARS